MSSATDLWLLGRGMEAGNLPGFAREIIPSVSRHYWSLSERVVVDGVGTKAARSSCTVPTLATGRRLGCDSAPENDPGTTKPVYPAS